MDEAPMLYIGEKVGHGGPAMDIAVDPLEGTTHHREGRPERARRGGARRARQFPARARHLHGQDRGRRRPARSTSSISTRPLGRTCAISRRRSGATFRDLVVCILERDRHNELVAHCREAGARIMLIGDGDVAGVIATALPQSGVDIYMGSGGAPEGVLAAAALRCIGGQMQGRLIYEDDEQIERARGMGITDPKRKYGVDGHGERRRDVRGDGRDRRADAARACAASAHGAVTHSMVMRSKSGTVRYIEAHHNFETKTWSPA